MTGDIVFVLSAVVWVPIGVVIGGRWLSPWFLVLPDRKMMRVESLGDDEPCNDCDCFRFYESGLERADRGLL